MPKLSKPNSEEEVFSVMKDYCQKKGYSFSDTQLRFFAENCYLLYESKSWYGVKYWPPLAMKWCLNNLHKQFKQSYSKNNNKEIRGKTVRQRILEEQENE